MRREEATVVVCIKWEPGQLFMGLKQIKGDANTCSGRLILRFMLKSVASEFKG